MEQTIGDPEARTGRVVIQRREYVEFNTDPQRRCYDGCHFSSEFRWTTWTDLEYMRDNSSPDVIEQRLKFWRDLNAYAVKSRGKGAQREFRSERQ